MKIKLIAFLLLILTCSCEKNVFDRIPLVQVNLKLNKQTTATGLVPILSHESYVRTLSPSTWKPAGYPFIEADRTGFGGILVVHGLPDQMFAFDLACPIEASQQTLIQVTEDGLHAVCPKCNSKYEVAYGSGAPTEGAAKDKRYFLRRYLVYSPDNIILYISQ